MQLLTRYYETPISREYGPYIAKKQSVETVPEEAQTQDLLGKYF